MAHEEGAAAIRSGRTTPLVFDLLSDVRYAFRTLRRSPGFASAAILTLTLGIGANVALFSVVDGALLSPLPYHEGEELVVIEQGISRGALGFSVADIGDVAARSRAFEGVAEHHSMSFTLITGEGPEEVETAVVSANYFDLLGVSPLHGRTFRAADGELGAPPVVVLSNRYWRSRFDGNPDVVGRVFQMNGQSHEVVGVLGPVPQYPYYHDVYMTVAACPIRSDPGVIANRDMRMFRLFGRLAPSAGVEAANQDLSRVAASLASDYPASYAADRGHYLRAQNLKASLVGDTGAMFWLLLGATGLVLLLACANLTALALARMTGRDAELAVRGALGASGGRLTRQLLTENAIIGLVAGGMGLLVALPAHALLADLVANFSARAVEIELNLRVLAFAGVAAVGTGLLVGALPAWRARRELSTPLRSRSGGPGRSGGTVQSGLVVVQVAVAFLLLIGSVATVRSFLDMRRLDLGYDPGDTATFWVPVNSRNSDFTPQERTQFYMQLIDGLNDLPGVHAVAVSTATPMGVVPSPMAVRSEGHQTTPVDALPVVESRTASEQYLQAAGIPLVRGRSFKRSDNPEGQSVAMINEGLADRLWPGADPVGRRIRICRLSNATCVGEWRTVVGVYGDFHLFGPAEPITDMVLTPSRQAPFPGLVLMVRAEGGALSRLKEYTDVVHRLHPGIAVTNPNTLAGLQAEAVAPQRLTATLLSLFGALALLVAAAGVAGLLSFVVSQRRQAIGIRMALGEPRSRVLAHILRYGATLAAGGLVIGGAVALALGRALGSGFWGLAGATPGAMAGAAVVLMGVAVVASWVPARRAAAVDPKTLLRDQ